MAGRSHVIARTFDRVCGVLDELGYLTGDTVTAEGRGSAGSTPSSTCWPPSACARDWDGLTPAELAACVSALAFESRQLRRRRPAPAAAGPGPRRARPR